MTVLVLRKVDLKLGGKMRPSAWARLSDAPTWMRLPFFLKKAIMDSDIEEMHPAPAFLNSQRSGRLSMFKAANLRRPGAGLFGGLLFLALASQVQGEPRTVRVEEPED